MLRVAILSTAFCLILAPWTTTLRGFTIRFHRTGTDTYADHYRNVWAPAGETPQEWNEVKQNPEIDQAHLYRSSQRRVRADKRRILDRK
jgi:hypothetical protein